MCCALVTRDNAYPKVRRAHPTVHAVSPSGVPLLVRQPKKSKASNLPLGGGPPTPTPTPTGPRGGSFTVLPPIKETGAKRDAHFALSELDDIMLKNEVLRAVRDIAERVLHSLLSNLRSQDRDRDGILTTDVVKGTLKKFQMHLSEDALRNLCKKFGQNGERQPMVRYEDMFNYLTKSRMEVLRAPPPKPSPSQGGGGHMNYVPLEKQYPRKVSLRNRVLFTDRDEAKLIIDLERELADKPVNMADLRRVMIDLDRDRNDFLSGQQVDAAFAKCGIILSQELKSRLLLATDRTGAGMYKIETLMKYISKVKPEAHNVLLGNNHHPRQARVGRLPMYQKQSLLTAPWEYNNSIQQQHVDTLPDEGFSEERFNAANQYPSSPIQQMHSPVSIPPAPPTPPEEEPEEFDIHRWTTDYNSLAQAVYNADPDRNGYMRAEEVYRITSSYNTVYNLRISDENIYTALKQATDPNFGEVNLEYFIAVLQDLQFVDVRAY